MAAETIKQFTTRSGLDVHMYYDMDVPVSWDFFDEQWTGTDTHVGGVTVANPEPIYCRAFLILRFAGRRQPQR